MIGTFGTVGLGSVKLLASAWLCSHYQRGDAVIQVRAKLL
jgi:hypothetical protein